MQPTAETHSSSPRPHPMPPRPQAPRQVGVRTHVVTGATGFIGAALVLELLRRTDDRVVAVVRPGDTTAEARFRAALTTAAAAYEREDELPGALARCRVVAGDVLQPACGVEESIGEGPFTFWHSAASLRYENRYREEIEATNIDGTRNAIALAERLGVDTFNYVSTAYVAGKTSGLIQEALLDEVDTNNHYERSKVEAERLVGAARGFRTRILRPSIVIGHGRTMAATTFTGFYGFFRQLVQLRGMLERAQAGLFERTVLRMRVDPDSPLNLVPIDMVAEELARIGLSDVADGVFHVTHPNPPTVGQVLHSMCRAIGLRYPEFVTDREQFDWIDQRLDERIVFYNSYIVGERRFERAQTDAALGGQPAPSVHFDDATIDAYVGWYLARLEAERASLPVAR